MRNDNFESQCKCEILIHETFVEGNKNPTLLSLFQLQLSYFADCDNSRDGYSTDSSESEELVSFGQHCFAEHDVQNCSNKCFPSLSSIENT